jgi:hypothetical protein
MSLRDGVRQRQGETQHRAAQAHRRRGVAGFDQRHLAMRGDRHVKDDEDDLGDDGRGQVGDEATDPLQRSRDIHGGHSKK